MADWKKILFDTETNNLLPKVNKVHCVCMIDVPTGEIRAFSTLPKGTELINGVVSEPLELAWEVLKNADRVYGHNLCNFDVPCLRHLGIIDIPNRKVGDTMIMAQLLWPEIKNGDLKRWKSGIMPGKMIGSHSLEAWGLRLGTHKDNYGHSTDWQTCDIPMVNYCIKDVLVNYQLLKAIGKEMRKGHIPANTVELEHEVAALCQRMTAFGFKMDMPALNALFADLSARSADLRRRLEAAFPPIERQTTFMPKRDNSKIGYKAGVPFIKRRMERFNPSSRAQIAERLELKYNWKAQRDGRTGNVILDDDVLKTLDFPEVALLREYMAIEKILAMSSTGRNAWMKMVDDDGVLHPRYRSCGAVTGRFTHSSPNIAQVPSVQKGKDGEVLLDIHGGFGWESRSCFTVPEGWYLVGADMSGLELRCLAHYLAEWDDGAYGRELLTGDIHTMNQKAAGLPSRAVAKTFTYGWLYGAGPELLGSYLVPDGTSEEKIKAGKAAINKMLKALPALNKLRKWCAEQAKVGRIKAIDGRMLPVRKEHAALNTLLQSCGAIVCKWWSCRIVYLMEAEGFVWGSDFGISANVHDENQIACRTLQIAERAASIAVQAAREAGEHFNLQCPLDGEAKIGRTWAETH